MQYSLKCHCGAVEAKFTSEPITTAVDCNCSICRMKGALQLRIPKEDFELVKGEDDLQTYKFNTMKASHYFCKHCGIHVFTQPRVSTEHYSINLRCVPEVDLDKLQLIKFDGINWEESARKMGIIE